MNLQNLHLAAGIAFITLLAGCSSSPKQPAAYDPALPANDQAAAYIGMDREKHASDVDKVAITACNVMFAATTAASASTSPGLFGNVDNNRAEASVTVLYTLEGLSDEELQRMADAICRRAEDKLAATGYTVTRHEQMKDNEFFQSLQQAGRSSPYEYKLGETRYKVFTRSGDSIFDERYIGTASGLGQAFRAAAGTAAWQHETRVMDDLGVSGINLNILVDFAELTSDGDSRGVANKNTAEVSSKVGMSVNGEIKIKPHTKLKCWSRFGKRECEVRPTHTATFHNIWPVRVDQPFYVQVRNATTTGDKVGAGVSKALSLLGGGTSRSITRYAVESNTGLFEPVSTQAIDGFLDMTIFTAKSQ